MPSVPIVTKNLIILNGLMWVSALVLRRVNVDLVDISGFTMSVLKIFSDSAGDLPFHARYFRDRAYFFQYVCRFCVWTDIGTGLGPLPFSGFYLVTGIGAGLVQELVWYLNLRPVLEAINTYLITDDPAALSFISM